MAIGSGGGSITSSDGRIELTIPAGALPANTNISIQPVTNNCPGGIGLAYDLMPNGTKFANPALLTFHYADSDVNGTDPLLLYTAFQDSLGQWEIVDNYEILDSVTKTITFAINHFTIFELSPGIDLEISKLEFKSSESALVDVQKYIKSTKNGPLVPARPYKRSQVSNWAVNGNPGGSSTDGTIKQLPANGNPYVIAEYDAPSSIDMDRNVEIEVQVNEPIQIKVPPPGKSYTWQNKTIRKMIKLIADPLSFALHFFIIQKGFSDFLGKDDIYNDSADLVVNVTNGVVDIPDSYIQNYGPTEKPTSEGDTKDGPGWLWISDNTGLINIKGGSGFVGALNPVTGRRSVTGTLTGSNTVYPQFTIFPGGGAASNPQGGTASTAWPQGFVFILRDSAQLAEFVNTDNSYWGYTITPIH